MADKSIIRKWLKEAPDFATHVIIVCDTFDWDDYPIYVTKGQNSRKVYNNYNGKNMQRVMEVYDLSIDLEKQLKEHRVFNF